MKTKFIFAIIAILGAFAIYFWKDNELLAAAFVALVWGVYERFSKEDLKKENKALRVMHMAEMQQSNKLYEENQRLKKNDN